jgi:hypothetical protein
MAFKAELNACNKTYNLLYCEFGCNQSFGNFGAPISGTKNNPIRVIIESSDDTSLWEWSTESTLRSDGGSIVFYKMDSDQVMKQYDFVDAYITNYTERFGDNNTMVMEVIFSARGGSMGNGEVDNGWAM